MESRHWPARGLGRVGSPSSLRAADEGMRDTTAADQNFYEVLGVGEDADARVIRAAYRRLAKRWHPDASSANGGDEAKFRLVTAAYEVLRDPGQRAEYDRYLAQRRRGENGAGFEEPPSTVRWWVPEDGSPVAQDVAAHGPPPGYRPPGAADAPQSSPGAAHAPQSSAPPRTRRSWTAGVVWTLAALAAVFGLWGAVLIVAALVLRRSSLARLGAWLLQGVGWIALVYSVQPDHGILTAVLVVAYFGQFVDMATRGKGIIKEFIARRQVRAKR